MFSVESSITASIVRLLYDLVTLRFESLQATDKNNIEIKKKCLKKSDFEVMGIKLNKFSILTLWNYRPMGVYSSIPQNGSHAIKKL